MWIGPISGSIVTEMNSMVCDPPLGCCGRTKVCAITTPAGRVICELSFHKIDIFMRQTSTASAQPHCAKWRYQQHHLLAAVVINTAIRASARNEGLERAPKEYNHRRLKPQITGSQTIPSTPCKHVELQRLEDSDDSASTGGSNDCAVCLLPLDDSGAADEVHVQLAGQGKAAVHEKDSRHMRRIGRFDLLEFPCCGAVAHVACAHRMVAGRACRRRVRCSSCFRELGDDVITAIVKAVTR